MPINLSGITTGLLGYTLKKELLGDSTFWRETQIFDYELLSLNLTGGNFNSSAVHSYFLNDFKNRFSGDISVKVLQTQADYSFPSDSLRGLKYNVQIEVKTSPLSVGQTQPELSGAFYTGVNPSFFTQYSSGLNDFKEEFSLERSEAGIKSFLHNVSFGLATGNRTTALTIASGIFSVDYYSNLGSIGVSGGESLGDTGYFRDYYSETFDTFRHTYSFSKRREVFPFSGSQAASPRSYNLKHKLELRDNGIIDVVESSNIKGYMSFAQSRDACNSLLSSAYSRCNDVYNKFKNFSSQYNITDILITGAKRTSITYNHLAMTSDYEIEFTNDAQFSASGVSTNETMEMNVDEKNLIDIKHSFDYVFNRKSPPQGNIIYTLSGVNISSPKTVTGYYLNSQFYNAALPIKWIQSSFSWPSKKNKATATFQYSNHPRFFVTINNVFFYFLDTKVQDTRPVDIVTEYKVVNRPSKLSVINYAYQTQRGQIQITLDGGAGYNPNEFLTTFRSNTSTYLTALYRHGIELFMKQFVNIIPIAFTYQLSDIKYTINSEGIIQLVMTVDYTVKKYTS